MKTAIINKKYVLSLVVETTCPLGNYKKALTWNVLVPDTQTSDFPPMILINPSFLLFSLVTLSQLKPNTTTVPNCLVPWSGHFLHRGLTTSDGCWQPVTELQRNNAGCRCVTAQALILLKQNPIRIFFVCPHRDTAFSEDSVIQSIRR